MSKRFGLWLVAMAAVLLVAGNVSASDNGFYVGASVGLAKLSINDFDDDDVDEFDFKADDNAYKIFLGYRVFGFLAVEGSYVDLGRFDDSTSVGDDTLSVEAKLKGYDVFAMGMLPLGIADIFAKVGVIGWDSDITVALGDVGNPVSDSGSDAAYGLGAQFRIKSFAIRAEIEYFDVKDFNSLYMVSVGGSYTF